MTDLRGRAMASPTPSLKSKEKDLAAESVPIQSDVEHGHLKDLEVDVAQIVNEGGQQSSIEDDTSPYPEGTLIFSIVKLEF
jgi:hypothetical protein